MKWETASFTPKPYPLGGGDTLMVRTRGYGFCPENCKVDHFHIGHKKNYDCGTDICEHIVYEYNSN